MTTIVHRVYVPGLGLWWFSSLAATKAAVNFHLYGALICQDNIIKVVAMMLVRFIVLVNQLASLPESSTTSEDCLQSHANTTNSCKVVQRVPTNSFAPL